MTERTILVEQEESVEVCDECGLGENVDGYGELQAYSPSKYTNPDSRVVHYHERCYDETFGQGEHPVTTYASHAARELAVTNRPMLVADWFDSGLMFGGWTLVCMCIASFLTNTFPAVGIAVGLFGLLGWVAGYSMAREQARSAFYE